MLQASGIRAVVRLVVCLLLLSPVAAAQSFEFLPGAKYDPAIPTLKQITGHDFGEKITMHHEGEKYLFALQQAAGTRMKVIKYAESWEGRPLYLMVIGSPANISRLDQIKAGIHKLADARVTSPNEATTLINSLPSIVWLICGVHGNEISSVDSALLTAYHLLAARGDEVADAAMKNSLVLIDPMQNPDGRDRFINYFRQNVGRFPDADLQSAEHNEVWPGGRTNHYLFDMNRDWFTQSQPETRGRTKTYLEWFPQVVADQHEMGTNSSFYFAPPALPWNPNLTKTQLEWLSKMGRNNAAWFDRFKFDYFTREGYDSFYPGYGEGWPLFHGSIGMTYEQASVRGLVAKRDDETTMLYRDSVHHHFIAALATIESTAKNRAELLRFFYDHRRTALEEGKTEAVKEFIITPGNDPNRAARLAATLMMSGIEVKRADAAFNNPKTRDYNEGQLQPRDFSAGSFIVSLAQPAKRLAKTLLDKQTNQDKEFLDEQRRRNKLRQNEEFYDVTGWSLPFLFDVPVFMAEQASTVQATLLKELPKPAGQLRGGQAKLAYVVAWGTQSAASALADLFRQDVRVHSYDKAFKLNGVNFPAGSLVVKLKDNPANLHERMTKLAAEHGVDVYPTDTSWVEDGPNFGSSNVNFLPRPRVAIAYNAPVSANSVGWLRYLIEQRYGYPVTTVRTEQLRGADLSRYNVLILPDTFGGYSQQLGDGAGLREWVQRGGTLIGIGGATAWLADEKVNLLATKREKREKSVSTATGKERAEVKDEAAKASADPLEKIIEPTDEFPSSTPGAILRVKVDQSHWLGFGYGETTTVMTDSNRIFSLIKLDRGTNVAVYLPEDRFFASGFMFDDARKQIPNKAYLMHARAGRGNVVGFAEDPNYRAFMDGLNVMFLNAVFFGPGH
ncbi:MAG TPA: M14 family metallopeptidase [Blastocatellia bacterium]|nr:M14 family metallopeptidase [Blastocatellia bacterium]HNG30416.1 M14 family metallopeptidase [Blastocatellia bacterium]